MPTITINEQLSLTYPENYLEMSSDELAKAYNDGYQNRWGIKDENRHIIICIQWGEEHRFLSKIADVESVLNNDEKKIRKMLKDNSYSFDSQIKTTIDGMESEGFRYDYSVQGIEQHAEHIVFKHDDVFFKIYIYTRKELLTENRTTIDEVIGSIRFV